MRKFHLYVRDVKHFFQRLSRGYDDACTWNLEHSLAKLILPRLKLFKKLNRAHPMDMTSDAWDAKLDLMIAAFMLLANPVEVGDDKYSLEQDRKDRETITIGLAEFASWYRDLWW